MSDLAEAIDRLYKEFGKELLNQPTKLRNLLRDEEPDAKSEISILVRALDEGVPQDLLRVDEREPAQAHISRLVKKMQERGFAPEASAAAVRTWARGLGVGGTIDGQVRRESGRESSRNELPQALKTLSGRFPKPRGLAWLGAAACVVAIASTSWYYTRPELTVTGVEVPGGFTGDGKQHQVFLDFSAHNATAKSVQVRYVGGDLPAWSPVESQVELPSSAGAGGRVSLGYYQYRTTVPAHAKFEYVIEGVDGTRSHPYEQTLTITPVPAALPQITSIRVPDKMIAGVPFAMAISYTGAEFGVEKIERKVIQSSTSWDPVRTVDYNMRDKPNGMLEYEFSEQTAASTNTFEFTLIDSRGNRSAPRRVSFTVSPAANATPKPAPYAQGQAQSSGRTAPRCLCGVVVSVQQVQVPGQTSGAGAVAGAGVGALAGNQIGHGTGRTLSTIMGGVLGALGGNKAEQAIRSQTLYEVTVRLDNGGQQVIRQRTPPSVHPGERAQIVHGIVRPA
jgi:outer membrane lipoprotein SlyB